MKLRNSITVLFFCFNIVTIAYSQNETLKQNESKSTIGVLAGYSESIVRSGTSGYNFSNSLNKDNFTNEFRGYVFGLSYNKKLLDNNNFATFTGEILFQKLPTYYESSIGGGFVLDHEPKRPPTLIKNSISNYMVTVNAMYNFNLFHTGFAFSLGGSMGYSFNNQIITNAIVDSNVIDYLNESYLTPLEPFVFGEEGRFTFTSNPDIKQLRFGFIFGLNYNLKIQNTEFEPFVRYNISATNHSKAQYHEDFLHSFQTGLSVRFPF